MYYDIYYEIICNLFDKLSIDLYTQAYIFLLQTSIVLIYLRTYIEENNINIRSMLCQQIR